MTAFLVDTNVWIDHLRTSEPDLVTALESARVLGHPWVTGELAVGSLARREEVLTSLDNLPQALVATPAEARELLETHHLFGRGIGYVDLHLCASVLMTPDTVLWTADRRLYDVAGELGCARRT